MIRAYVVFTPEADLWWLKFLKWGYRHCFVLLNDGQYWISIDPLSPHMDVTVHTVPPEYDLPAWFKSQGHNIIEAAYNRLSRKPAPWALFTCVEVVKRVLGIRSMRVITPHQLFKYIQKHNSNQKRS